MPYHGDVRSIMLAISLPGLSGAILCFAESRRFNEFTTALGRVGGRAFIVATTVVCPPASFLNSPLGTCLSVAIGDLDDPISFPWRELERSSSLSAPL